MGRFRIDVEDTYRAVAIGSYCSLTSLILSFLLVAATVFIRCVPEAKHHVDRISWRLFVIAMGLQVVFAGAFLVMYADRDFGVLVSANKVGCSIGMMLTLGTRQVVSWLIAAIAVNLALTVTWSVHVGRHKLERWYIASSLFLGYFPVIVGAARGTFGSGGKGWNICYFRAQDSYRKYLMRAFFTFYLGMCTATAVSIIAVIIALSSIFKQARATSRLVRLTAPTSPIRTRAPADVGALLSVSAAAYMCSPSRAHRPLDPAPPIQAVAAPAPSTESTELQVGYVASDSASLQSEVLPLKSDLALDPPPLTDARLSAPPAPAPTPPTPPTPARSRYSAGSSFSLPFSFTRDRWKKRSLSPSDTTAVEVISLEQLAREDSAVDVEGEGDQQQHPPEMGGRPRLPRSSIVDRVETRMRRSRSRADSGSRKISTYSLDDAFLSIALRVSVYPLVLIITNTLYISCDIIFYIRGTDLSDALLPLYIMNVAMYASRGALLALVGFLVDPGFSKGLCAAVKAALANWRSKKLFTRRSGITAEGHASPHIGMQPRSGSRDEDDLCSVRGMFGLPPRRGGVDGESDGTSPVTPLESPTWPLGFGLAQPSDSTEARAVSGHTEAETEDDITYRDPFDATASPVRQTAASTPVSPKTPFARLGCTSVSFVLPERDRLDGRADVEGTKNAGGSAVTRDVFGSVVEPDATSSGARIDGGLEELDDERHARMIASYNEC